MDLTEKGNIMLLSSILNVSEYEGYVEVSENQIFIRAFGHGSPLIILHGGPGLDHSYLVKWIAPLSNKRKLIFYDQLGCGKDTTPISQISVHAITKQLRNLVEALNNYESVGLLAHSWGAHVILSLIQKTTLSLNELVFISPTPLTSERLQKSVGKLVSRFPDDVLEKFEQLRIENDSTKSSRAMQLLLPYYVGTLGVPNMEFSTYDMAVEDAVNEDVGAYDLRDTVHRLPKKNLLIYGDEDFFEPEGTKELHTKAQLSVLSDVGHFPFAENPKKFLTILDDFLTR